MIAGERTYQEIALADPGRCWELHRGRLREKPSMTIGHNRIATRLAFQIGPQLDPARFEIRINMGRARRDDVTYYVPDVCVVPLVASDPIRQVATQLEVFDGPLPLVVEVWSPSTGDYDVDEKLPEYMRRGDLEIWRLHPFDLTLTVWRRGADGGYEETLCRGGIVEPVALPGVAIDLDRLFA